jgi:hypothetical protein
MGNGTFQHGITGLGDIAIGDASQRFGVDSVPEVGVEQQSRHGRADLEY